MNGIFRDREVVMRGMDHRESAQKLINAYRIHYNFVREHSSIKKTPAEQAGIKLDLGQNKIENLIKLASKQTMKTKMFQSVFDTISTYINDFMYVSMFCCY